MLHYSELTQEKLENMELTTVRTNKKKEYYNIECGFDIETTSSIVQNEKVAFMYIWQLGIGKDNSVYYGRTWDELLDFLELISKTLCLGENKHLVIYVHNFGYEFQFMRKYFQWTNVFAVNERKPIKALCSLGIEFRDSYILSGYSLENTAKNLTTYKVKKMVGDLDYSKIRHSETKLSDEELKYCENDILVILCYIKEQIEQYGNVTKIPLTNTGRVRTFVRNNCYYTSKSHKKTHKGKYIRYRKIMEDLTIDKESYIQLKRAFMGGFTHSNPYYTNLTLENVDSVDLTSSYPTVMLSDMFPMSRPRKLNITNIDELENSFNKHCVVFDVKFTGLRNKIGYESYLSDSKCFNKVKTVVNNGRIYSAESLTTTITDVDFNIIKHVYEWDEIAVKNVTGYVKNYLPKAIIESILELYEKKTTLKDVDGFEVEYLLSKGMLNSIYGMCVTDFIKDEHTYSDGWEMNPVDANEKIEEYNKSKNRFLYYPWGIWVTAYARRNLWSAILSVGEDYIYSDTDSVKMLNFDKHKPFIESYNKHVTYKLELMIDYYKLDKEKLSPKTIKGVSKPLGVWDYEGHYTKFKTLGAKRYLIEENDKYQLTVAGLSKKNGMEYIIETCGGESDKIFNMFDDNLYIPESRTGKMTHTYVDSDFDFIIEDYDGVKSEVHTKSGIHLGGCEFTLSISRNYNEFLSNLKSGIIYNGVKHI